MIGIRERISFVRRCGYFFAAMATLACFAMPAWAGPVTLFVGDADTNNNGLIHRFDATTGAAILPDIAQDSVTGLAIGPGGDLFAASINQAQVYRYNSMTGALSGPNPFVAYGGIIPANDVHGPEGMAFAPNGNLYIADVTDSNVHEFDTAGNSVTTLGADPSAFFSQPTDVAFDASGDLYVVNPSSADVLKSIGGTQQFTEFVSPLSGGLTIPQALTFGPDGKLYVLDASNNTGPAIRRYTAAGADDGTFISYATTLFQPNDIAFGPDGKLYVSGIDLGLAVGQVLRYSASGAPDVVFVGAGLNYPTFMAFSVPEPASIALLAMAGIGLLFTVRRKRTA
jgi:sugar lactone lactonase YvrE